MRLPWGNTLEGWCGAWLLQTIVKGRSSSSVAFPPAMVLMAAVAPIISATLGVGSLFLGQAIPREAIAGLWKTWWVGDAMGALLVAPLWISLAGQRRLGFERPDYWWARLAGLVLAATGVSAIVFLVPEGHVYLFTIFPILLLAVAWFGSSGTKLTALFFSAVSVVAVFYQMGPFVGGGLNDELLRLQLFITAVAVVALVLPVIREAGSLLLPGTVLLVGWLLSGLLFSTLHRDRMQADEETMSGLVNDAVDRLEARMSIYIDAMRGGVSLFAASESVEQEEWRAYADSLSLGERYPGINGIGVVGIVKASETNAFLETLRQRGVENLVIKPVAGVERPADGPEGVVHFPIIFIEPLGPNLRARGLDLASEKHRRLAAQSSRETGKPRMTRRIVLVQDGKNRPGFLLYVPLYQKGAALQTPEDRLRNCLGWVYAPFVTENFLNGVLGSRGRELRLSCFEGRSTNPADLLYQSEATTDQERSYDRVTEIELAGETFTLAWNRGELFPEASGSGALWAGSASALVSLLLASLVMSLQTLGRKAQALAEERTRELHQSNAALREENVERRRVEAMLQASNAVQQAILRGAGYMIITMDRDGLITSFNPAAERLLGYTAAEAVGRLSAGYFHDAREVVARAGELQLVSGDGVHSIIKVFAYYALRGQQDEREWTYVRRDGSRFAALVSTAGLFDERGELTGVVSIGTDISERKRQELELRRAKEMAEAANEAKSTFVATMSHEIRTPMNGVLGFARLLHDTPLNETQRDYVATIQHSGEALLLVINDILDFSKIEAGKLAIEHIPFSLHQVLADLAKLMTSRGDEKGLPLTLQLAPGVPDDVMGDPGRLRQVLLNLVGNALKFTDRGSVVLDVTWEAVGADHGRVRFAVTDTGIGIPADKLGSLFSPFTQADSSTTRRFGGTGLGLVISKRLVELMGGRLKVTSTEGVGSTFVVTLDYQMAAPAVVTPPVMAPARVAGTEGAAAASLKILLAEDNPVNQKLVTRLLEKLGCTADLVDNGAAAVERVLSTGYDLVLMDCNMPGMDGFEATANIRRRQTDGPRPRIIALTANAMQGDRERCLAAGMDDYLTKPLKPDALRRLINTLTTQAS